MADTEYTIEVQAEGIGTDATADEIVALGDRMAAAEKVATKFDRALEVAGARLAEQSAAAEKASAALAEAEAKYKRLERAATMAAKRVEKAASAGKDTTKLRAAAESAAAAVRAQAQAVDQAADKADAAAKSQERLASAYKRVEKAADRAAEETRGSERSFGDLFGAAGALGGPLGGVAGQISGIGDGLRAGGKGGGLILGFFALGNAMIMAQKAAIALTLAGVGVVAMLLKMAVAADDATSKKLEKAWDRAKKKAKGLFEGVKTEKLVRPVESLLRLLDKSTSAGKGLAKIFEALLNPIIDGLDKGEPLIKEFFKGMILGALRTINAVLRLRNAIVGAIPKETREKIKDFVSKLLGLNSAAKAGEGTFKVLAFAVLALAGAFAILTVAMLIPIGLLALFTVVPIIVMIKAIEKLRAAFKGAGKDATEGGKGAGTNFVQGIVEGITAGVGAVVKAARSLIKAAIGGANKEAEARSPSRKMIRFARYDMAGAVAIGLRQGEPAVEEAGRGVSAAAIEGARAGRQEARPLPPLRPAPMPMTSGATTRTAAPGKQIVIKLSSGAIVVNAPTGDGEDIAYEVRRVLLDEVELAALQIGGGELVEGTT